MVKAGDAGEGDYPASARWFDGPSDRRIAVERHVWAVLVVIRRVGSNQSEQMVFAEHDDVVEDLAPKRAHEPLRVPVLPRRSRGDFELANAQVVHTRVERGASPPVGGKEVTADSPSFFR
jgi:hypothetical protein